MTKPVPPKKPTLAERFRKQTLAERLQPKSPTLTERLAQDGLRRQQQSTANRGLEQLKSMQDAVQRANNQRIQDETRQRSAETAERARKMAHDAAKRNRGW